MHTFLENVSKSRLGCTAGGVCRRSLCKFVMLEQDSGIVLRKAGLNVDDKQDNSKYKWVCSQPAGDISAGLQSRRSFRPTGTGPFKFFRIRFFWESAECTNRASEPKPFQRFFPNYPTARAEQQRIIVKRRCRYEQQFRPRQQRLRRYFPNHQSTRAEQQRIFGTRQTPRRIADHAPFRSA